VALPGGGLAPDMTAKAISSPTRVKAEETRMLRARLNLIVSSVPIAIYVNPAWAAITILPFAGFFPVFGAIAWWRLAAIMILHIANSFIASALYRGYLRDPANSSKWLWAVGGFQMLIGTTWGLMGWLLWVPGNPVNNIFVMLAVIAILWAYAFSRAMHSAVYFAGVTPTVVLTLLAIAYSGGPVALPLAFIIAVTFGFTYAFAFLVRRQVERQLRTGFANEDLAAELRDTRDDALRKRFEAEAANASKTTFLANMSHELRTPLNAILGFSELIANETLGPVGTLRYRDYASDINASGSHLLSLINDILDIAKIEAGKMDIEPVALEPKPVIEKALTVALARAREKRQHVVTKIDAGDAHLVADERAVKQIVINLVSNAVKFTPEGGNILISGIVTSDGGFQLCVEDDGPGIPAALLERIFTPFNQIDNRYSRQAGGTGLGLSLVRGLAELHGGRAWIESDVGAGVRAFVYFPKAARTTAPQRAPARLRA
jgi:two-component system cell cycle sensor histidine kinase PleC